MASGRHKADAAAVAERTRVDGREDAAAQPVGHRLGCRAEGRHAVKEGRKSVCRDQYAGIVGREATDLLQTGAGLRGELGERGSDLRQPGLANHQVRQVGLGEVAVVRAPLLPPHHDGLLLGVVPETCLLVDGSTRLNLSNLAFNFEADRFAEELEGVEVLHLHLGPKGLAPDRPHRDVGIAAHGAVGEDAIVDADGNEDGAQLLEVGRGLFCGAQLGLGDNLDETCASPVEVDERVGSVGGVRRLPRILFHVDAGDAAPLGLTGDLEEQLATFAERRVELGDLVALREVGIEVVLSGELALAPDVATEGDACAQGQRYSLALQHGERARVARAYLVDDRVCRLAEGDGTSAENLGIGAQLRVDFEPDDGFVLCLHDFSPEAPGGASILPRRRSSASAAPKRLFSAKGAASSCTPTGSPSEVRPAGTDIAGRPARLAGMV